MRGRCRCVRGSKAARVGRNETDRGIPSIGSAETLLNYRGVPHFLIGTHIDEVTGIYDSKSPFMSLLVDNISIGGSYSTRMHTTTIDISKNVWRSQMYWFRLFRKKRGCTRRISQVVKTKMFIRLQAYCIESLRCVQPQPRLWFTKNAPGFLSSVTFHLRSFTVSLLLYRCSS